MTPKSLYRIWIETDPKFATVLERGFALVGVRMVIVSDLRRHAVRFEDYVQSQSQARRHLRLLEGWLRDWSCGEMWLAGITRLDPQDWCESWKKFFRPIWISPRLIVKPPWSRVRIPSGVKIISIEPGLSFGTGNHPTTKACLEYLDDLLAKQPGAEVLDIGCGSGILAIAAALLGAQRVFGIDSDKMAVAAARRNCELAGLGKAVNIRHCNVRNFWGEAFRIVVANISRQVLIEHAARIGVTVAQDPAARLVLSGMLRREHGEIRARFESLGFREVGSRTLNGWTTICLKRAGTYRTSSPASRQPSVKNQIPNAKTSIPQTAISLR